MKHLKAVVGIVVVGVGIVVVGVGVGVVGVGVVGVGVGVGVDVSNVVAYAAIAIDATALTVLVVPAFDKITITCVYNMYIYFIFC